MLRTICAEPTTTSVVSSKSASRWRVAYRGRTGWRSARTGYCAIGPLPGVRSGPRLGCRSGGRKRRGRRDRGPRRLRGRSPVPAAETSVTMGGRHSGRGRCWQLEATAGALRAKFGSVGVERDEAAAGDVETVLRADSTAASAASARSASFFEVSRPKSAGCRARGEGFGASVGALGFSERDQHREPPARTS